MYIKITLILMLTSRIPVANRSSQAAAAYTFGN